MVIKHNLHQVQHSICHNDIIFGGSYPFGCIGFVVNLRDSDIERLITLKGVIGIKGSKCGKDKLTPNKMNDEGIEGIE